MPTIACPTCRCKLRVPDRLTGPVRCPKCQQPVPTPQESLREAMEAALAEPPSSAPAVEAPLPLSARLGMVALGLGLLAVLVLCLPFLGYASPVLSGVGLLLGLAGLVHARRGGIGNSALGLGHRFGTRARDYPLAGIGVCLLALALALLPFLRH
jgi:hypothetical protein